MCTCIYGPHYSRVNEWEKEFALSMAEWLSGEPEFVIKFECQMEYD